jgi:heme oxygenase
MLLTTDTVSAVLKRATAIQHAAAEADLMPKLAGISSKEDYAALLKMYYGFYEPVQRLIAAQPVLDDMLQRRSSEWILSDLRSLSVATDDIPLSGELPHIHDQATAFGALYVLEGSTLGGRMIKKMMLKNKPWPVPEASLRFFDGYGENTGHMWKVFQHKLNEQQNGEAISAAANETFTLFRAWIGENS